MKIYIRSARKVDESYEDIECTDYSKFSVVFMLMQKYSDGMYCLGKFYADNLWAAKEALQEALKKHPNLADANLYVSKYNSYFDTEENRKDPDGVEVDVADSLEDLIEEFDYEYAE